MSAAEMCEATTTWTEELCGAEATAMVVVACAHEHLKERRSCEWHRQMSAAAEMVCHDCKEPIALLSSRSYSRRSLSVQGTDQGAQG